MTDIKEKLLQVFKMVEGFTGPLNNSYIAGGAIASLVLGEEPKDYDIWFENPEDYFNAVNSLSNNFRKLLELQGHTPSTTSKYATSIKIGGIDVQLVQSRMGAPEVVVPTFDFKHTQSWMKRDGTMSVDEEFIKRKQLVFVPGNFSHPVNTMQRVNKFARRGYDIPFETTKALMMEITKLDPESIGKSDDHGGSL